MSKLGAWALAMVPRWLKESVLLEVAVKSRWAKWVWTAIGVLWAGITNWGTLRGELPSSVASKLPPSLGVLSKLLDFMPPWAWLFLLLVVLVVASVESLGKRLRRFEKIADVAQVAHWMAMREATAQKLHELSDLKAPLDEAWDRYRQAAILYRPDMQPRSGVALHRTQQSIEMIIGKIKHIAPWGSKDTVLVEPSHIEMATAAQGEVPEFSQDQRQVYRRNYYVYQHAKNQAQQIENAFKDSISMHTQRIIEKANIQI
jgi:hypothetical protein